MRGVRACRAVMVAAVATALLACAPRATLVPRGIQQATSTADVLDEALAPRRFALLVGIDAYADPAFPDLQHARDDAEALAEVLRQKDAGFDEVTVLTAAGGTDRQAILDALRELRTRLRTTDELVVYFAGHGTRAPVEDEAHRFLLPSDASPTDLPGTALDLEAVLAWFMELPPARKGIVVDACFDGGGRSVIRPRGGGWDLALPERDVRTARLGPGDAQLFATTPGRPSLEDDQLGHGVYTWYLLEALGWGFSEADRDGDGVLTLWEAHDHARGRVVTHTGGAQVPEAVLRTVGQADVVLRGRPGARRQRDQALLYLYADTTHPLAGADLEVDGRSRGALPGTHPVPPGRHEVVVRRADGVEAVRGFVDLQPGRAYRVEDLAARVEGARGAAATRVATIAIPGLEGAMGPAAVGAELVADGRFLGPRVRGLILGGHAGIAASLATPDGASARPLLWVGPHVGYQADVRRMRWRAGWSVDLWWMPARGGIPAGTDPLDAPERAGWVFASTGPFADVGIVFARTWTAQLGVRLGGTALAPDPDGPVRFVPVIGAGLGVSAGW